MQFLLPGENTHELHCNFCFLAKKCTICIATCASWRKNAPSSPTTGLPDEKTHRRRRRQGFLAKKRAVVADDKASWRKYAPSSAWEAPPARLHLLIFFNRCRQIRFPLQKRTNLPWFFKNQFYLLPKIQKIWAIANYSAGYCLPFYSLRC